VFDLSVFRNTGRDAAREPAAAPTAPPIAAGGDAEQWRRRHARHRHQLAAARHHLPAVP
jgi:hypothetical protein